MPYHVGKERFGELVEAALRELPPQFVEFVEEVPIEIRQRPTRKQLSSVGLAEDELLLGLYHGHPRTKRHIEMDGVLPDVIYLFQEDIELICDSEPQLVDEVRKTLLHEIGHHFGLDENELDELGYG